MSFYSILFSDFKRTFQPGTIPASFHSEDSPCDLSWGARQEVCGVECPEVSVKPPGRYLTVF